MQGLMQDVPLSLTHLFERAERIFPKKRVITSTPRGREEQTYAQWADRTRRLATVLDQLGISADGRVATFAWNSARHLELYFAPACSGRVVHTLNLRLFPDQLTYIVNHAEDEVLFVDNSVSRLLWPLLPTFESVRHIVMMDDCGTPFPDAPPGVELHDYETLVAGATPAEFPTIADENQAVGMAYTSGTTGNPKGVVYSHRSMVLHTIALTMADGIGVRESDVLLPVVPMFHANAWGLVHAGVAVGASIVMPGPDLSPPSIAELIERERVTVAAGVPTIWMGVLPELKGRDLSALRAIPCGGSAVPKALSEGYRLQTGLPIMQAWGMTETSPVATACVLKSALTEGADDDAIADLRTTVGIPFLGVDLRIADPDTGAELPWDGASRGELQARGPWIARSYYNDDRSSESFTTDGWLRTGDIATIDPEGYVSLVDRTKDLVKSGGEWISSVELENEIMAHPAVREAAVIGVPHAKWVERPLACVVLREGETLDADELREFLTPRVPKWWLPDDVVFVDEIPKTSVGKFSKKTLRDRFADHELPPS
jgi:fatty-acyl-CoA synthase